MHPNKIEVDERLVAEQEEIDRVSLWMKITGKTTWDTFGHTRTPAPTTWGLPARVSIC